MVTMDNSNVSDKLNTGKKCRDIIKVGVFVIIFVLSVTALTYILRTNGDTKNRFMGFYAEPKNSLDVILIGSSPTYSSCVFPELYGEYGIKAYPLASNVQRPVAGLYLVKEAQKTQSPDLYMFEMRMYVGIEEGLTNSQVNIREVTDNMKYSRNRLDAIKVMTGGRAKELGNVSDKLYTFVFDIFKYHSNWRTLIDPNQWASVTYTRREPMKGYKITDKVGPAPETVISEVEAVPLDPYQEAALSDLIAYLKDNGLNALFYVSPYTLAEGDAERFATIKEEVETAGFKYLDMNQYYDEIGINFEEDFSDNGVHTNAVGAQKCTRFIGDYLKENYALPDRRVIDEATGETVGFNDTDSTWEKAYRDWQDEYEVMVAEIDRRIREKDYYVEE